MKQYKIYLASHFFDAGGRMKTQVLADEIRKEFGNQVDLYVPQENGDINDKTDVISYISDINISKADNERLSKCDILIADLDGVEVDSGVSAEIGYIAGKNTLIEEGLQTQVIGFTTDIRINRTEKEILTDIEQSIRDSEKVYKLDNLKDNHLYRNLYVRGLVKENGTYISSNPNSYIEDIINELEEVMNVKED